MKTASKRKTLFSAGSYVLSVLTALLIICPLFTLTGHAITSSSENESIEQDYFNSDYAYLGDDSSVYHALTYDQLITLFEQEGNYLILFGGSWCSNTNPVIGYINEVAKQYGVESIYTFDFRFDGMTADTHIRESNGATHSGSPVSGEAYNYLYGELVTRYLGNLNDYVEYKIGSESELIYTNSSGEDIAVPKVQVPFLFLYNKDNRDEAGQPAQIVSGIELMKESSDFIDENNNRIDDAIAEYKDILRTQVFYAVESVDLASYTDADYYRIAYNRAAGKEIFAADEQINIKALTYRQLYWLLGRSGNYLIYFGGAWSENSAAVIKAVNELAVENHVIVYNFDTKFDGGYAAEAFGYSESPDISDSESVFAGLYTDLIEKLAYDGEQLPESYFLAYNKNTVDNDGHSTPILVSADGTNSDYLSTVSLVIDGYQNAVSGDLEGLAGAESKAPEIGQNSETVTASLIPRIVAAVLIAAVVAVAILILAVKDKKPDETENSFTCCC